MLVIYSTLQLSPADHAWIESVRAVHDPQHRFAPPHVTFVFPFTEDADTDVLAHAQGIARETSPIDFRLSRAAAVKDPLGPMSHLFLLPTAGAERMQALHARLYSGPLARHRHPTLAFQPHVTVGAFARHEDAENAARALPGFDIGGTLGGLCVAAFDGSGLSDVRELPFGA